MKKKIGDYVKADDLIAVCYSEDNAKLKNGAAHLKDCIQIGEKKPEPLKLVVDIIY